MFDGLAESEALYSFLFLFKRTLSE